MGNIGNTQGVKERSRPIPKKPVRISQKLPLSNIRSILRDSVSIRGDSPGDWNSSAADAGFAVEKGVAATASLLIALATAPAAAFATGSVSSITLLIGA